MAEPRPTAVSPCTRNPTGPKASTWSSTTNAFPMLKIRHGPKILSNHTAKARALCSSIAPCTATAMVPANGSNSVVLLRTATARITRSMWCQPQPRRTLFWANSPNDGPHRRANCTKSWQRATTACRWPPPKARKQKRTRSACGPTSTAKAVSLAPRSDIITARWRTRFSSTC